MPVASTHKRFEEPGTPTEWVWTGARRTSQRPFFALLRLARLEGGGGTCHLSPGS